MKALWSCEQCVRACPSVPSEEIAKANKANVINRKKRKEAHNQQVTLSFRESVGEKKHTLSHVSS